MVSSPADVESGLVQVMSSSDQLPERRSPGRFRSWRSLVAGILIFATPLLLLPFATAAIPDSWQPYGLRGQTILQLKVVNTEGGTGGGYVVYAETASGLWRRRASDRDWERIDESLPHARGPLAARPGIAAWQTVTGRPQVLYALTGEGTVRQLFRTDDGGTTWRSIGPAPGFGARSAMAVMPGAIGAQDSIMIATGARVQRSLDGGATWAPGGPWPGSGESSEPVHELSADGFAHPPGQPGFLLALARAGELWIGGSGGLSWRAAQGGGEVLRVSGFAVTPAFRSVIWIATADGLSASTDNGATWLSTGFPASAGLVGQILALTADPSVRESLYVALSGGRVYRTDDFGASWSYLGVPGGAVSGLAVEPGDRRNLFAETDDGVWVRSVMPVEPTAVPTPTMAPPATATQEPTPTPTRTSTATPVPTSTQPAATITPSPSPTLTRTPTATPTHTATPTRVRTRRPTAVPVLPTATFTPAYPTAAATSPPAGEPVSTPVVQPVPAPGTPPPR